MAFGSGQSVPGKSRTKVLLTHITSNLRIMKKGTALTMDAEQEKAFDKDVRRRVYDYAMREGLPPTIAETASALARSSDQVRASFQRLATGHILVLQKGSGEILMANPFSAVPTPFVVKAAGRSYFGNCIWDAMGISAMLNQDAAIEGSCGCCRDRKSTRLNSSHIQKSRMPSSA